MKLRNKLALGLASLVASASSFAAPAAAIDVTDFTGTITNQQTSVVAVVGITFVLLAIVVGVGYMRRAAK